MNYLYDNYETFLESDYFIENEEKLEESNDTKDFMDLIANMVVSPKCGLELYINTKLREIDYNFLEKIISNYSLDINDSYKIPTDSHIPTTLLNSFCEFRDDKIVEKLLDSGADPNVVDTINYTPFKSLISGHSAGDIGRDHKKVIKLIKKMIEKGMVPHLEKWQYEELYMPYISKDKFFEDLSKNIVIHENSKENYLENYFNKVNLDCSE